MHLHRQASRRSQTFTIQPRRSLATRTGPQVQVGSRLKFGRQCRAPGVVDVDHRSLQPGPVKQGALGSPVDLHAAVVVQVILREIGEHGHTDAGAGQPVFGQTDGRRLDRGMVPTALGKVPERALQQHRVGRGHAGAFELWRATGAQRADQATRTACLRQGLRQPPGTRGLAVGAGHSQHGQVFARALVPGVGDRTGQRLERRHAGQAAWVLARILRQQRSPGVGTFGFEQAGARTLRQRGLQVLASVGGGTGPGDEGIPRTDLAAVGAQIARDALAQPARHQDRVVQGRHQNDSSTALATICGLTAMSGCTPSRRSVCCTVSLKTGAATSPP